MTIRQGHAEHRARQHLGHAARQLNWFFLRHLD
jgi:hypothetical protein